MAISCELTEPLPGLLNFRRFLALSYSSTSSPDPTNLLRPSVLVCTYIAERYCVPSYLAIRAAASPVESGTTGSTGPSEHAPIAKRVKGTASLKKLFSRFSGRKLWWFVLGQSPQTVRLPSGQNTHSGGNQLVMVGKQATPWATIFTISKISGTNRFYASSWDVFPSVSICWLRQCGQHF